MAKSKNKKGKVNYVARVIILIVILAILGFSLLWQKEISVLLGLYKVDENKYDGASTDSVLSNRGGNDLVVHFVDVGQGDATIIELPDNKKVIIDGGKDKEKSKLLNYIDKNITFADVNNKYFDYAILTHPDEDHCGGLDDVLELYPAKVFYRPREFSSYKDWLDPIKKDLVGSFTEQTTLAYQKVLDTVYKSKEKGKTEQIYISNYDEADSPTIKPKDVEKGEDNYYEIEFFTPIKNNYKDRNDYSPIMILEYEDIKMAFSGDAEKEAEAEFVDKISADKNNKDSKYYRFSDNYSGVDVIKLGHHGSRTSSSENYLKAITNEQKRADVLTVASCGLNNSYGHPHKEVLTRLDNLGFSSDKLLRTDTNSDLVLSIAKEEQATAVDTVKSSKNTIQIQEVSEYFQSFYNKDTIEDLMQSDDIMQISQQFITENSRFSISNLTQIEIDYFNQMPIMSDYFVQIDNSLSNSKVNSLNNNITLFKQLKNDNENADKAKFVLKYGADVVRVQVPTVSAGPVNLTWAEIVYVLMAITFFLLILRPLLFSKNKKVKKGAKTATEGMEKFFNVDLDGNGKVGKANTTKKSNTTTKSNSSKKSNTSTKSNTTKSSTSSKSTTNTNKNTTKKK